VFLATPCTLVITVFAVSMALRTNSRMLPLSHWGSTVGHPNSSWASCSLRSKVGRSVLSGKLLPLCSRRLPAGARLTIRIYDNRQPLVCDTAYAGRRGGRGGTRTVGGSRELLQLQLQVGRRCLVSETRWDGWVCWVWLLLYRRPTTALSCYTEMTHGVCLCCLVESTFKLILLISV